MSPLTSATEHPLAAGHSLDAAQRFRLVLENAPAGSAPHAAGEEAMPIRVGRRGDPDSSRGGYRLF